MTRTCRNVFVGPEGFASLLSDASSVALQDEYGLRFVETKRGGKPSARELAELLSACWAAIAGTEAYPGSVIKSSSTLELIIRAGAGYDNIDLSTCASRNVSVGTTPTTPTNAVAELTVGLIIGLLRSTFLSNLSVRNNEWSRPLGREISTTVFGIVGAGRIGQALIEKLSCLGAKKILVYDVAPIRKRWDSRVELVTKSLLLESADIVSLHLPLTTETRGFIGVSELALMRPTSYLVNTARGGLLDEEALENALTKKQIAGAALDTLENEPYRGPLARLSNCFVSAHLGPMTKETRQRMARTSLEELTRFLSGEGLRWPVLQPEASDSRPLPDLGFRA